MEEEKDVQDTEQYDVVIVGGGAAGMLASLKLCENKIKCCVLEASNRIGGRAFSEKWTDNIYLDFGCQWIHYAKDKNHQLIDIAKNEYGIDIYKDVLKQNDNKKKYKTQKGKDWNNWLIWDIETKQFIPPQIYELCTNNIIDTLEDELMDEEYAKKMKNNKNKYIKNDYSIHQVMFDLYNETMINNIENTLEKCNELNHEELHLNKHIIQRLIDWSLAWFEDYESLFVEESYYHFFDDEPDDHDDIDMEGKYGLFIQMMANKLNEDKYIEYIDIKLNNIVKSIEYINENKMKVIVNNEQQYICRHVIICVSIGCLQERSIIFKPNLLNNVWNTIDNGWGMYKSNKIILHFDGHFTKNNHINKLSILSKQPNYGLNVNNADNINSYVIPGQYQKYSMATKINVNNDNDNIWIMFLTPRYGQQLYDFYKNEIKKNNDMIVENINKNILNDVLEIFQDIFCDKDDEKNGEKLPKLKKYHITNWDKNDFYRGSWCYFKKHGDGINGCKFIQNFENRNLFDVENKDKCKYNHNLLFAGEWTESGNGCCFDAIKGGRRAAQQIIDTLNTPLQP